MKLENDKKISKWKDTVKQQKLDIAKLNGDLTTGQPFIDSFNAAMESSYFLTGVDKFNYLLFVWMKKHTMQLLELTLLLRIIGKRWIF